jgi:hypothetical protein
VRGAFLPLRVRVRRADHLDGDFRDAGPGGNTSARWAGEHILTTQQAKNFTVEKVFLGQPKWIDYTYSY